MRVLLDEQLPRQLAPYLAGHDVRTVQQQRWAGLTNGELLKQAEIAGFEVFLTADQNLEFQQNLPKLDALHRRSGGCEQCARRSAPRRSVRAGGDGAAQGGTASPDSRLNSLLKTNVPSRVHRRCGLIQDGVGYRKGEALIRLHMEAYLGAPESYDSVTIEGSPRLAMTIAGGVHGDVATASIVVNSIPKVLASPPGLRTMRDLPIPSFFGGE